MSHMIRSWTMVWAHGLMVWAGAEFGTDIGKCHLICPVVSTGKSVFENYHIAKGSFPGKDQASLIQLVTC